MSKANFLSFRTIRITILLGLLALAAGMTYWERWVVTSWMRPLEVIIYPINGDGSEQVQQYIDSLSQERFQEISAFISKQGERYRPGKLPPIAVQLEPAMVKTPPAPEGVQGALSSMAWSLRLRNFAFRHTPFFASLGKVRLFVVYHEGEEGKPLQHSLGLTKGLIGVVHAFAKTRQGAQNNVVITHELLHALGATDKYDANLQPSYPEGFGEPQDSPHYPQLAAEIMAGRIALSPTNASIPDGLDECVIGYKTAHEINW